jgi:hypothetical protein
MGVCEGEVYVLSYGANYAQLYGLAVLYVAKILKGAKPADLPVQQPTEFELVINLTGHRVTILIPAMMLALGLLGVVGPAGGAGPWRAQIVDAETGEPLARVVIVASWIKYTAGPAGASMAPTKAK